MSYDKSLVYNILHQIHEAIQDIEKWNADITCPDDYAITTDGLKTLAATSMLLEAIGEGIKRIDTKTAGTFLASCPQVPWREIMGMRDHIAHGYFDIDAEIIFDVVKNELGNLNQGVERLKDMLDTGMR